MADIDLDKPKKLRMGTLQAAKLLVAIASFCFGVGVFWKAMQDMRESVSTLTKGVDSTNQQMIGFGARLVELSQKDIEIRQEIANRELQSDLKLQRATEANFARIDQRLSGIEEDIRELKKVP